jgi:excisionase family DNA binding protein
MQPEMNDVPRLLTLEDVATRLRISPHTVRKMVREGRLPVVRICRRLLFNPTEILRLLGEAEAPKAKKDPDSVKARFQPTA